MPKAENFVSAFSKATKDSSGDPIFQKMIKALRGKLSESGDFLSISLDTSRGGKDDRVIEDAVRAAFNDDLGRARYPDALFEGIPVEIKHTTSGFRKLPTDSYGLTNTADKWYLFVKGTDRIKRKRGHRFGAWLMRSDHLLNRVNEISPTPEDAIIPSSETAADEIRGQIHDLEGTLANIIRDRALGKVRSKNDGSMSLARRVGSNRVRFDIKFESLLREIISDMIKD
jgi:hypothetical protein